MTASPPHTLIIGAGIVGVSTALWLQRAGQRAILLDPTGPAAGTSYGHDRVGEWMGHRPATGDSLPVIGQTPNAENVYVGYGHQHVGLTGVPKTGRWLAPMIIRQPVNTDLSPFAPDRWGLTEKTLQTERTRT